MSFVNLFTTTEYSMLYSPMHLNELIAKAKEYKYQALGICDLNSMHGVIKFYDACIANNIKPIVGLYLECCFDSVSETEILLYARDDLGYKNLLKIASRAKMNGLLVDYDFLCNHNLGLICVLPGEENEVIDNFLDGNVLKAKSILEKYKSVYSCLYLGLDQQTDIMKRNIASLVAFGKENNVKSAALNKSVYLNEDDYDAFMVLRCIDQGKNEYLLSEKEKNMSFRSCMELENIFQSYKELIINTEEITSLCTLTIGTKEYRKYHMPVFFGDIKNTDVYLEELCKVGLNKRLRGKDVDYTIYRNRLLYELSIIKKMGFADYFLIVYDYVLYAKKNHILVGPGRGSAPSSLCCYSLGITDVDPIEYDLLFERFLNPERVSMPDIDIDFPDNAREKIITYVGSRYGKAKVAHISTFGTFGPKLAVRDISRVINLSSNYMEAILTYVQKDSIIDAYNSNQSLQLLARENQNVRFTVEITKKLEGLPRHVSTHAAGIIMSDDDLVSYTPLQEGMNDLYQTQYEASDLEKIGLVKMDFLGLRNLTIIDNVLKKIFDVTKEKLVLSTIPMNDKETYQMLANGDTDGVFQFESRGMRSVLMRLKSSQFMDLVSANALYRPGPMEMIQSFIERKFKKEEITYLHPDLEPILKSTYGIIVFQEQIMLIARKFAGYSLGEADVLRRAVSKKKEEVLVLEREKFVKRSINNGYEENVANQIYDYIVKFANYGFNKPHSVCYSLIAYQMAYLKRHYYQYFMAELMSNSIGSSSLIRTYIGDLKKNNINVLLPSVNYSSIDFCVSNEGIYYSLLGVNGLGLQTALNLISERETNGLFKNYDDFIARTNKILNKKLVETLIASGALDEFSLTRKQMFESYENSLNRSKYGMFLEGKLIEREVSKEEFTYEVISKLEKEALGFNMKYNLFLLHQDIKEKHNIVPLSSLEEGTRVNIFFIIKRVKEVLTKNNELMAFVEIYDDSTSIEGVMFKDIYQKRKNILEIGSLYVALVNVEKRNGKKQVSFYEINLVK